MQRAITDDVFGKCRGDTVYEGLVDAHDVSEFDSKLALMKERWAGLDPKKNDRFCQWFTKYESEVIKETMLRMT